MTDVLNDGISQLVLFDHMGNDSYPIYTARASVGKENKTGENDVADARLLRFLGEHGHETPFEHNALMFFVKAPMFVVRQWQRHRIGWSYNELSRRYTQENIQFHIPKDFRAQDTKNRQGSGDKVSPYVSLAARIAMEESIEIAYNTYQNMLENGIAREQARMVLPVNIYTSMFATCNLRSLVHFIKLRDHEGAQEEIRAYARAMREEAEKHYPNAIASLMKEDVDL